MADQRDPCCPHLGCDCGGVLLDAEPYWEPEEYCTDCGRAPCECFDSEPIDAVEYFARDGCGDPHCECNGGPTLRCC